MIRFKSWRPNYLDRIQADVIACSTIVVFFVAFFPQALFGGRYLLSGDSFFYSYPMHTIAWQIIREGSLPLWSPYTLSGYPLLSMTQLGLGYPLTWGHLFLPGYIAEQIYILAPFLLAPLFTYFYVRKVGRSPLASTLAALSFGFGGMMASPLGNSGMMMNAALWLPIVLIALERSRTGRFIPALLLATAAYTLSVLNGFGQGFVYVGILALGYAVWLVITNPITPNSALSFWKRMLTAKSWRPLAVVVGAGLLAAGISAFQILETARVVRRSIRSSLDYQTFTQGSFTPTYFWKSFITPLYYVIDMHAYVPPLVVALALFAVFAYFRGAHVDKRILYWLFVAVVAAILMLGSSTPFYRIVYHIPIVNLFRVPSRHTFEWTFATSVLAAYGWDAVADWLKQKRPLTQGAALPIVIAVVLLVASSVTGIMWWRRIASLPASPEVGSPSAFSIYLSWKTAFVLICVATLWRASRVVQESWRFGILLFTILILCFVEPSALVNRWWGHGFDASRFHSISEATKFLQQFPPEQGRVYTRVDLMSEQYGSPPRFDSPNFSAIWGLHNVGGYEPLLLERYSRALGEVGLDTVRSLKTGAPDDSLLGSESHVLDILNTSHIISYQKLATALVSENEPTKQDQPKVPGEILPNGTKTLSASPLIADSLDLVTSLSNAAQVPDDAVVARVQIFTMQGAVIEHELRAGRDTAEWAYERPDVRPVIKHRLAPIFDSVRVGDPNGFTAYRFKASFRFAEPVEVSRVKISNVSKFARLGIFSARITNSQSQKSAQLHTLASEFMEPVYEHNSILILRNTRAQPRAWLVAHAEAVDGEEALKRIRGESLHRFDPQQTALLEVRSEELPTLPGGVIPRDSVQITKYAPNSLTVETNAPIPGILVLSEIFFPGWKATIDGKETEIYITNYLLRSVAVPAGRHKVEMHYEAPAARNGAVISAITLTFIVGLLIKDRRRIPVPNQPSGSLIV